LIDDDVNKSDIFHLHVTSQQKCETKARADTSLHTQKPPE